MTPHYPLKPIVVASFRSLALVAGTFLLSSCSVFDNDLPFLQQARDDVAQVSPWPPLSVGEQTAFLGDLLASERLDALVTEALTANPSLQQTLLTLQIRQAERRETNASRLPSVDAGLTATREENTSGDGSNDSYTSSLTVSWEVDLWSKLADGVAAVDRDIDEQRALYQSARDTLAAEVMQAWVSLVASKRGIAIEERRVATLESNTDFILSRYRNGLGELEDLQSARSSLASARANLVEEQENLEQNLRALPRDARAHGGPGRESARGFPVGCRPTD